MVQNNRKNNQFNFLNKQNKVRFYPFRTGPNIGNYNFKIELTFCIILEILAYLKERFKNLSF